MTKEDLFYIFYMYKNKIREIPESLIIQIKNIIQKNKWETDYKKYCNEFSKNS